MTDRTEPIGATIEDYFVEDRTFPPPDEFAAGSLLAGRDLYAEADADARRSGRDQAGDLLAWSEHCDTVLEWELPFAKWFVGGKLNVVVQLPRPPRRRRPRRQGRLPLGGRARRHPHHHLRRPAATRSHSSPTCSRRSGWRRATGSPSTCR